MTDGWNPKIEEGYPDQRPGSAWSERREEQLRQLWEREARKALRRKAEKAAKESEETT